MKLRAREPDKVRADAVRIAVSKFEQGCDHCGEGYLQLAHENGATYRDVEGALAGSSRTLSRRVLLKWSAVTLGLALGADALSADTAAAATTYYWGTDTNTVHCKGIAQDFYIGKGGGGTTQSWQFNTTAATDAGKRNTYMYWDLHGPTSKPSGETLTQWGKDQAQAAHHAWNTGTYSSYIGGTWIFADIEPGNIGNWQGSSNSDNRAILNGYIGWFLSQSPSDSLAGVYINPSNWVAFFGSTFKPSSNFLLWTTDCHANTVCNPGNGTGDCNCDPRSDVRSIWSKTVTNLVLGGVKPSIWQWYLDPDYNVTIQDPNGGFIPRTASKTFNNPC